MQFLGCLLAFFFIIVWLIIGSVANIWRATFGRPRQNRRSGNSASRQQASGSSGEQGSPSRRRKMFEDNEGEYVDYVEL